MLDPDSKNAEIISHVPLAAAITQRRHAEKPDGDRIFDPEWATGTADAVAGDVSEKTADVNYRDESIDDGSLKLAVDYTRRKLKPRHINLIGIGGTIGTALYVQIGEGLRNGGPASLFLAFTIW